MRPVNLGENNRTRRIMRRVIFKGENYGEILTDG